MNDRSREMLEHVCIRANTKCLSAFLSSEKQCRKEIFSQPQTKLALVRLRTQECHLYDDVHQFNKVF